ncbi:MAG TPA: PLP-dependent aminotransferase family protein [Streptosporangiaceae bacterium]|jgi:GntR family transcriptional regulator/MocR family aminotransferase
MTTSGRTSTDLPLVIDRASPVPLTLQIAAELREAMADGRLGTGDRIASSRALASALRVSRTVVTSAYAQLYAEGWLDGRHGSGTFVAAGASAQAGQAAGHPLAGEPRPATTRPGFRPAGPAEPGLPVRPLLAGRPVRPGQPVPPGAAGLGHQGGLDADHREDPALPPDGRPPDRRAGLVASQPADPSSLIELRPGIPWASGISQQAWRRAWRFAGRQPPPAEQPPAGRPALRTAVAGQLRRSRGIRCDPGQVVITRGVASSLRLLAVTLLQPGDVVVVEEPGYPAARAVFAAQGAVVMPCRADEHGLVVGDLPDRAALAYVTPAHQYPLGGRLSVPRRQALIGWARSAGALIVEDDYDSEFRYDVAPLPALFGLDPEVVVYLGTTSKTLTPALGVGWLVATPRLAARIAAAGASLGERVSDAAQHAFGALLGGGELDRHVRRMRREYARRRAVIVESLSPARLSPDASAGWPRLLGDTAGLHVVLELPPGTADRVAAQARSSGVAVFTLERYFAGPPSREGLVLGYGGASVSQVSRGCDVLAGILAEAGVAQPALDSAADAAAAGRMLSSSGRPIPGRPASAVAVR